LGANASGEEKWKENVGRIIVMVSRIAEKGVGLVIIQDELIEDEPPFPASASRVGQGMATETKGDLGAFFPFDHDAGYEIWNICAHMGD